MPTDPERATTARVGTGPRLTHGRHCNCSACAAQDWSDPALAPCGMHGPSCPPEYAPYPGVKLGEPSPENTEGQADCPTCGHPREVVTSDEGTSYFKPPSTEGLAERLREWARRILDTSSRPLIVLDDIHDDLIAAAAHLARDSAPTESAPFQGLQGLVNTYGITNAALADAVIAFNRMQYEAVDGEGDYMLQASDLDAIEVASRLIDWLPELPPADWAQGASSREGAAALARDSAPTESARVESLVTRLESERKIALHVRNVRVDDPITEAYEDGKMKAYGHARDLVIRALSTPGAQGASEEGE